tara:strand:+ start:788 stop:1414 length:627 start_codon:yes stop_codon:yes gene_type:complete
MAAQKSETQSAQLTDFTPDPQNLNQGTERGSYALERSLRDYGFARPIVADKNGTILAGNHAFQKAGEIGLSNVRVVETSGDEIIIHKRVDLNAADPKARMVALADNRTTEINLSWDPAGFDDLMSQTLDVQNFFAETEINDLLKQSTPVDFEPDLNPTIGTTQITDEDVDRESQSMQENFDRGGEQDLIDICCPHCGKTFGVDAASLS